MLTVLCACAAFYCPIECAAPHTLSPFSANPFLALFSFCSNVTVGNMGRYLPLLLERIASGKHEVSVPSRLCFGVL
jgi:hypothetical protein